MLLLLAATVLLIFSSLSIGIVIHRLLEKTFGAQLPCDLFCLLLLGVMTSTVYFDLISLWFPADWRSLIPLLAAGIAIVLILPRSAGQIAARIRQNVHYFFSGPRLPITIVALLVFVFYWLLPPANSDSRDYHYTTIRLYEKYKVIPGLANIHGRYALNNASFLIQAAWSFTSLIGRPVYALNGVLLAALFAGLLKRSFYAPGLLPGFIYASLLCVLCTPLLVNISSPSSDSLVAVCVAWPLLLLTEQAVLQPRLGSGKLAPQLIPLLILLFSITAKLSSFPVLVVVACSLICLPPKQRPIASWLKIGGIAALLYAPWLLRNYIMTGYLVYPFPYLNLFHPDWQLPLSVQHLDLYFLNVETKKVSGTTFSNPPTFPHWLLPWVENFFDQGTPLDPLFFLVGILSPLAWIPVFRSRHRQLLPFLLWIIVYLGLWTAFLACPVLRYFAVLLCFSLVIPGLAFALPAARQQQATASKDRRSPNNPVFRLLTPLYILAAIYYLASGYRKPSNYPISLGQCFIYPPKDKVNVLYDSQKQLPTFPYKYLGHGVKLYIQDTAHFCAGIDQPCTVTDYGDLEMRGPRLEDGVRMIHDKVLERFPEAR